ncbi:MAG: DUF6544 family protein [Candidatus Methanospirareceae archaeon]
MSGKVYTSKQIKDLPVPVQRYFRYSLEDYQPYISYAILQHGGQFRTKPDQKWIVWLGKVPLSLIKIIDVKGKEADQGELLRWLGEAPLFPTALLPSENLRWEPIDNNSAKVVLKYLSTWRLPGILNLAILVTQNLK